MEFALVRCPPGRNADSATTVRARAAAGLALLARPAWRSGPNLLSARTSPTTHLDAEIGWPWLEAPFPPGDDVQGDGWCVTQRTRLLFLDNVAGWILRPLDRVKAPSPCGGQLLPLLAGAKEKAAGASRKSRKPPRQRTLQNEL